MSAFEVDDFHIHTLLAAGLAYALHGSKLRWQVRKLTVEEQNEVHRRGEAWGPGTQVIYGQVLRELTKDNAGYVGAMLLGENRRSVNHRYDEDEFEQPYLFKQLPGVPSPAAVFKALDCYEYQSCEHPEWEDSEAKRFCDALRQRAGTKVSGYEEAPWEVTQENVIGIYPRPTTPQPERTMPRCSHSSHRYVVQAGKSNLYSGEDAQEAARVLAERRSNRRLRALAIMIATGPNGDCCYEESSRVLGI